MINCNDWLHDMNLVGTLHLIAKCNRYILQQREESEYSADYGESVKCGEVINNSKVYYTQNILNSTVQDKSFCEEIHELKAKHD